MIHTLLGPIVGVTTFPALRRTVCVVMWCVMNGECRMQSEDFEVGNDKVMRAL